MKVRELQKFLSKLDPELDGVCYSEVKRFPPEGRGFILFDISNVEITEVERLRLDDGTPYLNFDKGPKSTAIVILEITSDF